MAQPDFSAPDWMEENSIDDIQERMMDNLPSDIDKTPGGFAYDFTMPTAIEKSRFIEENLMQTLMFAFPQYAPDAWLDLHSRQVHLTRHAAQKASGQLLITGEPGTEIEAGTMFYIPATANSGTIDFVTDDECVIGEDGTVLVSITANEAGSDYNVSANTITNMDDPMDEITAVTNPEPITGGTDEESDDDLYDRIAVEYDNSLTYLGNDVDYIRWAKEAGAGDCMVDSSSGDPGTVILVLVDTNGDPATQELCDAVYNYIVSPDDRSLRLLPTACAKLVCMAATSFTVDFTCTGLQYHSTTIAEIKAEFSVLLKEVFAEAKTSGVLRYNDVRPLLSDIAGVDDFDTFLIDGCMENIEFSLEEYPMIGTLDFNS